MTLLDDVHEPGDLADLTYDELEVLASEIRKELVSAVSRTGGHLGPNLGCVELTIALHRVFESPADRLLFDTGHQTYVHKLLTGRREGFGGLRQRGGLSGYPSRSESVHDVIENSHASTALSWADGVAKALKLAGRQDRAVVAVVGDGALTGGMAWEALNNIGAARDRPVIIVVNDNGRSYAPTTGGIANHFAGLRMSPGYEGVLAAIKRTLPRNRRVGAPAYEVLRRLKRSLKDLLTPQALFQDLGLKYLGPVDGHDLAAVETALRRARGLHAPVIVHCLTQKGRGYLPAENHADDCLHGPGPFDPVTGRSIHQSKETWSSVFGTELVEIAGARADVVAITAAMLRPTGLGTFAKRFPERIFDVGIAEQHAATSAAGLALEGFHPVVALYATFLNRAFDQVLMDVALHRAPVTFVLDRAGVTGDDGPSHNGMWDLSILQIVPGLRVAVPRDGQRLRELLGEAVAIDEGPTALRYPKGPVPEEIPALGKLGDMDVVFQGGSEDALLVGVGPMVELCLTAAKSLQARGIGCTVLDPRWVAPLDTALVDAARRHRVVVVVEDNCVAGGVGDGVARMLRHHSVHRPMSTLGIARKFLDHGKRAQVLKELELTAECVESRVAQLVAEHAPRPVETATGRRPA
ncbi:1-deoxy-D-xylulose-5-phosphate synthase [Amycolatopsis sp. TNS106]|uniref:1-deoxy-D-xylulose-5-phosphate synthase n=1 Tax=Amycolatopsis sp. TNS106 TaxID=2861750 RepID=UPI001C55B69C|nr:1-deoxy-D-xylulose-5-phosphate synthase [Amycolatopsis sp. TNS106]QXV56961.1 1-deoxy-D-xylulose-5-phosphate synthase [Amycolatopsis sp. TNS106]